jgi:60 kDa SS-A/Ro ribonucleoprotein
MVQRYVQHTTGGHVQTERARADQVQNNAGGFVWSVDKWTQLDRFLVLGAEGNTYYATERKLTIKNADSVLACLAEDGARVVKRVVEISDAGRAPKNDPAIFVLAMAAAADEAPTRAAALEALPKVCRIGTHLFHFVQAVDSMRGWGRGLTSAVAAWYLDKEPAKLAEQVLKYQQRDGWSHKDVLRLCHGRVSSGHELTAAHAAIFAWVRDGVDGFAERDVKRKFAKDSERTVHYAAPERLALPELLAAYEDMKHAESASKVVHLIGKHGFTREMIPTEHLKSPEVWAALLEHMPMTAMIRNLGKMTSVGVLGPLSAGVRKVEEALANRDQLRKARVHPITLLSALLVYQQGHGEKGKLTWNPSTPIVDALSEAFYLSFETIEPTGKAWCLGIDVSGSMDGGVIAGVPGLTPRIAAAAMAMVTARSEKNWVALGFTSGNAGRWDASGRHFGVTQLTISPKQRLDDVVKTMQALPMGGTDCALPIMWALQNKVTVDTFCTITDNETWAGPVHVHEAMKRYRRELNPKAKLIAVAVTADEYSIADPKDPGMLDVVGFDTAAPSLMADFARQ